MTFPVSSRRLAVPTESGRLTRRAADRNCRGSSESAFGCAYQKHVRASIEVAGVLR
jgi:hypothetical protein